MCIFPSGCSCFSFTPRDRIAPFFFGWNFTTVMTLACGGSWKRGMLAFRERPPAPPPRPRVLVRPAAAAARVAGVTPPLLKTGGAVAVEEYASICAPVGARSFGCGAEATASTSEYCAPSTATANSIIADVSFVSVTLRLYEACDEVSVDLTANERRSALCAFVSSTDASAS